MADKGRNSEAKAEDDAAKPTLKKPTCFVIMPIADHPEYPPGHFSEVYNYLIKPAIIEADFEPQRADETSSAHLIHADIINKVFNADLCICDLSTRNPNVLFELGFRQAFDKPTVLIKDSQTAKIFDVDPFRTVFYDSSLRPQSLEKEKAKIVDAARDTMSKHGQADQVYSLVSYLKLQAAKLTESNLSPENARLEILTQKIEALASVIDRQSIRVLPPIPAIGRKATPTRRFRDFVEQPMGDSSIAATLLESPAGVKTLEVGALKVRKADDGTIILIDDQGVPQRKVSLEELRNFHNAFEDPDIRDHLMSLLDG